MSDRVKIFTVAHLPADLQQAWLQHLRDFDTAHPDCHFEVGIEGGPDLSIVEMVQRLQIEPKLTFTEIFGKTKWQEPT
jgi:hypothetical protein